MIDPNAYYLNLDVTSIDTVVGCYQVMDTSRPQVIRGGSCKEPRNFPNLVDLEGWGGGDFPVRGSHYNGVHLVL